MSDLRKNKLRLGGTDSGKRGKGERNGHLLDEAIAAHERSVSKRADLETARALVGKTRAELAGAVLVRDHVIEETRNGDKAYRGDGWRRFCQRNSEVLKVEQKLEARKASAKQIAAEVAQAECDLRGLVEREKHPLLFEEQAAREVEAKGTRKGAAR